MLRCCSVYQLQHPEVIGYFVKLYCFSSESSFFFFWRLIRRGTACSETQILTACSKTTQKNISFALQLKVSFINSSFCCQKLLHLHILRVHSKQSLRLVNVTVHEKAKKANNLIGTDVGTHTFIGYINLWCPLHNVKATFTSSVSSKCCQCVQMLPRAPSSTRERDLSLA